MLQCLVVRQLIALVASSNTVVPGGVDSEGKAVVTRAVLLSVLALLRKVMVTWWRR